IAIVRDLLKLLWLVPSWIAKPTETAPRNKSLLVRVAVLAFGSIVSLAVLVVVFRYSSGSRPHLIMWYIAWTDLWNGISLLLSANLTAAALIVLAYGFLLQID